MAADQASLALDPSKVGSEDYLSSLTRRLDVLEKKIVGNSGMKDDQPPLTTTLNVCACLVTYRYSPVEFYLHNIY